MRQKPETEITIDRIRRWIRTSITRLRGFRVGVSLALVILMTNPGWVTAEDQKASSEGQDLELLAQWSLNYGSYLIDVGQYLEALEAFDTSYESSSQTATKVRALLHRSTTLATYLDAPEDALVIYRRIARDYPQHAETGHYREGLLLFDMGRYKEAVPVLEAFLRDYPDGTFRFQAEVLLDQARAELAALKPPAKPPAPPKPSVKPPEPPKPPEKKPKPPEVRPPRPTPEIPKYVEKPPIPTVPEVQVPVVRVLLHRKVKSIQLEGEQLLITDSDTPLGSGRQASLRVKAGQVSIDGRSLGASVNLRGKGPIQIEAGDSKKIVRGTLTVKAVNDRLQVVNRIDIESYLRGVVPSESYPSWPEETLKAQAVAARTYVLYQIRHRSRRPYDVVDHEGDQAYKGVTREHPRTNKAVAATAGEVLVKSLSAEPLRPIHAKYSANSGGHTADAKAIFRINNKFLSAKPDRWSLDGKMATWKRSFKRRKVEQGLAKVGVKVKNLRAIEPVSVGPSGRLIHVRLVHDGKPIKIRSRPVLTRALKLPEILMDVRRQGDTFVFNGKGWGHGVGYSQWGGAIMAKEGKDYQQILACYYNDAPLKRLW